MGQGVADRVFNFSAGPATLPVAALQEAQENLLVLPGAGASVMEISHRSKGYSEVHQAAKDNIAKLLNLPDNYKVGFFQGGATMQFVMIAMNFLKDTGKSADFILTGAWGKKALANAKLQGDTRLAFDGSADGFVRFPKQDELDLDANAAYCHVTSNETIEGVEYFVEPETGDVPLICDASSDILSRPLPIEKYGMIYAGAQKNIGPAGVALVIIRDDLLERVPEGLPNLLDYRHMIEKDSLSNTPPCFSIYMVSLVTKWLLDEFGTLDKVYAHNKAKAQILYDVIDGSDGFYRGHAQADSRSLMNVSFRLPSEDLEAEFIAEATAEGLHGLKGHRSVGGCRASIYNAMPREGVEALVAFMKAFQAARG